MIISTNPSIVAEDRHIQTSHIHTQKARNSRSKSSTCICEASEENDKDLDDIRPVCIGIQKLLFKSYKLYEL